MIPIAGEAKKRICYFFDSDIGNYHYGPGHPMKPHRIRMTHALVMNYGLYKKMEIFRAKPATRKEMAQFHTDDYVDFLSKVTPDNMEEFLKEQAKCTSYRVFLLRCLNQCLYSHMEIRLTDLENTPPF